MSPAKKKTTATKKITKTTRKAPVKSTSRSRSVVENIMLPRRVIVQIADEVAKIITRRRTEEVLGNDLGKTFENPKVLDTSAIIDGRVFDLVKMGVFYGNFAILEGVLDELKGIADSKDEVKRERGRKALVQLDDFKKNTEVSIKVFQDPDKDRPVDDRIVSFAKKNKGRVITCDYNLSKKAQVEDVAAINLYEMANVLKTTAVPGEMFYLKVVQKGKGVDQGVGYLPDGTMIVVEEGGSLIGKTVKVEVSRIIQTESGRILFAKTI